ncbi:MAG: Slp family lipoprotein [Gammaproteobacteria bacterium]|nr:Slp family lipoprotein [Gammaproteobacteria bacterium]
MINKLLSLITLSLFISLMTSCASTPDFDTTQVDRSLTPQSVIAEPMISRGKIALWGGTILDIRNMENITQIEVLAYPLNSSHRPLQENKPLGRFILQHKGYLEPTTFAQGKIITVLGSVSESQSGKIGESNYTYPVIIARQIHLWSPEDDRSNTSFHFGIGVRL